MSGQQDSLEKASQPTLCAANCGFYSNSGPGGLCSKCFREKQVQEGKMQAASSALQEVCAALPPASSPLVTPSPSMPPAPTPAAEPAPPAVPSSSAAEEEASGMFAEPMPVKVSSTRCMTCRKKVGLTGFSCRCHPEAVFCSTHRYAEAHNCSFDYKAAQRQQLEANNPLVQASKVQKL